MLKKNLIEALKGFPDDANVLVAYYWEDQTHVSDLLSVCENRRRIQLNVSADRRRPTCLKKTETSSIKNLKN